MTLTVPDAIAYRGGDCRAYCRRCEREVYGPSHPFPHTTDLALDNGRVRLWVGNKGMAPFLNLEALVDGEWWQSGVVMLAPAESTDALLDAHCVSVTPDEARIVLIVRNVGEILVSLRHNERSVYVTGAQYCIATAMPPSRLDSGVLDTGAFRTGLRQAVDDDIAELLWPADVDNTDWTIAYRWLPNAASGAIGSAGLGSIVDTADARAVDSRYDGSDHKAKMTIGANTVQSNALTFAAGDDVFVCHRLSPADGMALSVKTPTNALQHVKNAATGIGTTDAYKYLALVGQGAGTWGAGTWGAGTWGGSIAGKGTFDNAMVFRRSLDDSEVAALAGATAGLGGLTGFEGDLVTYFPFDVAPVTPAGTAGSGRVVEATVGEDGLQRMVAGLSGAAVVSAVGLGGWGESLDFVVSLITGAAGDTAADVQGRLAAANQNKVRVA